MSQGSATRARILPFLLLLASPAAPVVAATLPAGFQEEVVFSGLTAPTNIEFAPDGRIFVAEKSGLVKVFDSLSDPTPDVLADLRTEVHDFWDRGLLGLAVDPDFPTSPYVYVLYTYNFDPLDPSQAMPLWPDSCPTPPGATGDGCVVNGRVSRLEVGPGNTLVGSENVLIENRWCQQFPSHSIGDLVFDDHERILYLSAGDGASFNYVDYGQSGGSSGSPTPRNPCGDPPTGRGGTQTPPTAEGGALRSQDIRSAGDPVGLNGSVLRIDPDTGQAPITNPLWGGDPEDDLIIAYGLRNPFRMTVRPGTHEVWIGDVGWNNWEEIDRITDSEDAVVENFGWPCYEGVGRQGQYDGTNLDLCENLYAEGTSAVTAPFLAYLHSSTVAPGTAPIQCSKTGSSSISGLAFETGTAYPAAYAGALFFADYSRDCLWVMFPDGGGVPDPATVTGFVDAASNPVDLEIGPDGLLYYADLDGGRVIRINYFSTNEPPIAVADADRTDGPLPLDVQFDASASSDPDAGTTLTYAWDLDGDGQFDDSTLVSPSWSYPAQGQYLVGLRVTDDEGEFDEATLLITAGNTAPVPSILSPPGTYLWRVGDEIVFDGAATDDEDGPLPSSALHWEIILNHCPEGTTECHAHPLESHDGVATGSFTAPDHEWRSELELVLTATDSGFPGGGGGVLTGEARMVLDPDPVTLSFETVPTGLTLLVSGAAAPAPFDRQSIIGASNPVVAVAPQNFQGSSYDFVGWSDGGAAAHSIVAQESPATYTATYEYAGIATDWWSAPWRVRQKIQIDNSGQTEPLLDFPLLITLSPSNFDYARAQPGGADVRFVDADAVTELPHEIDEWVDGGVSRVWVRVPQIDAGPAEDFLWLYYGNETPLEAADAAAVWSNGYAGVWHLRGDLQDSGPYGNDGTNNGSTSEVGPLGAARYFGGSAWVDVGNDASLGITGDLTLEAWLRLDDPNQSGAMRLISKKATWDGTAGYNIEYKPVENHLTNLSSGSNYGRAENIDLDTAWHYIVTEIEGTAARLFLDGVEVTTDNSCDPLAADSQALHLGRRSGGGDYLFGALDEVRVSSVPRSPGWVAAQYLSMSGALAALAPWEDNCAPVDATCDGFDDDCSGAADEDAVPPGPWGGLTVDPAGISWPAVPTAQTYEVVRGDVTLLRSSAGDLATSAEECVAAVATGTSVPFASAPPVAAAWWFLVRGANCAGPGSFDSGGAGQTGPRNDPAVCP